MKDRGKSIRQTGLITVILFLSAGMCFSTGFAAWVSTGGDVGNINGLFHADSLTHSYTPVFSSTSVKSIFSFSKYGFAQTDGSYRATGGSMTASVLFDAKVAKGVVASLINNNSCSLTVSLYARNSSKNFTTIVNEISITSETVACGNDNPYFVSDDGDSVVASSDKMHLSKTFQLTSVDVTKSNIIIETNLSISYIGNSFETFYNTYSATDAGFVFEYLLEEAK